MKYGVTAGILWALDTVILGIALAMTPFVATKEALFLAPFVSTFVHDLCSSLGMFLYLGVKKQLGQVARAVKTRSGRFIMLSALLGGPVGMTGYVMAINYIGPAYTAIISSVFPALGALFSYIFLKEKMRPIQIVGLFMSIAGVIVLGYVPGGAGEGNMFLGFVCALVCCVGWASEAVICAYGMKDPDITNEHALMIRQVTSAIFYGIVLLNVFKGWKFTISIVPTTATGIIAVAALFGTACYVLYYKSIITIGASKTMALNITYSAWAIVFSLIFLHTIPDIKGIICAVVIVSGSIVAGSDKKVENNKK